MRIIRCWIFCFVLISVQALSGQVPADGGRKTANYPTLAEQAEEIGKAIVSCDFAEVADLTYRSVVEGLGGRTKMIAFLESDSAQMKAEGFELEAIAVGGVKQISRVENELFAVVPFSMRIKSPNGRAVAESSLVGISNDSGASWKFINGINQARFESLFPKAAEKIRIPAEKPPRPVEN